MQMVSQASESLGVGNTTTAALLLRDSDGRMFAKLHLM